MELLLGSNLIALYFIVSIGIIAYERFTDVQKLMILYGISYIVLVLDILAWQPLLLAAFAMYFIDNFWKRKVTATTYKNEMYRFNNHIKPYFGEKPLRKKANRPQHAMAAPISRRTAVRALDGPDSPVARRACPMTPLQWRPRCRPINRKLQKAQGRWSVLAQPCPQSSGKKSSTY